MKIAPIFLILLSAACLGDERIQESSILTPEDLNIVKFDLRQPSNEKTVAVLRVEHRVQGEVYTSKEYVYYTPDSPVIGTILLFSDEAPNELRLPVGRVSFAHDKRHSGLSTEKTKVTSVDGQLYEAECFRMASDNEEIRVYLYAAPMEVYRKKIPNLPRIEKGVTFRAYSHTIVEAGVLHVSEKRDGEVSIMVHRTERQGAEVKRGQGTP